MDSLEYSIEALDAKGLFYNKEFSVYVEGKDDILYWKYLFELADVDAHIEDVGGDMELEKYILKILDEGAEFIVACDNHHNDFLNKLYSNPRIVSTYGYSIENSMYNTVIINEIIGKLGRGTVDLRPQIEEWANDFSNSVFELLVYDIASNKYGKGIAVFGDNCIRFLKSPTSHLISLEKVKSYIDLIKGYFTAEEIAGVEQLIHESDKRNWFLIKGHFLTHGVLNVIRHLVGNIYGKSLGNIPCDMLYSLTINVSQGWGRKLDVYTVIDKIVKIKDIGAA